MKAKVFVSVGTHPQQFNRLLKKIDELIEKGMLKKQEVFAQIGYSDYNPKNYSFKKFVPIDEFKELVKDCELFITHGGEGNIGTALQYNKKMIIVPRLKKFGEHTNDHQLELTKAVEGEGRAVAIYEIEKLAEAIKKIEQFKPKKAEKEKKIISLIEEFLKKEKMN